MWNLENRAAFRACVADLLNNPEVQKMREVRQHVQDANCLQHCLFVAYLSFLFCRKFHLDAASAARGGLLHDLYLYDWRTHEGPSHDDASDHRAGKCHASLYPK